ncbi:Transmembrane amino acid transporter protein [Tritrichomonas foetus]|uniref:Transmembrane amino acid transporter protein n=1 Tax=Tritrichomonas foetus TaxID=1144522 RepID=A0A1J4JBC8_9EUKA|nr:Transmembrane amino acid transporter protein [Tritrichomonas foetus]|eukprot:OHS94963.1 Transmembrane amino acid transporter protein [Tritrichomonas foetus]
MKTDCIYNFLVIFQLMSKPDSVELISNEPLNPLPIGSAGEKDEKYTTAVSDFSKNNEGQPKRVGFFGTVMNLLNSLIGAEILSISRSMRFCGLTFSVGLMTLTALLSYIATILTVRLQFLTRAENFNDLAVKLFGKWGSGALSILVLLFTYSCCVAYLIIGGNNIKSWLQLLNIGEWMEGWKRMIVMFLYSILMPVVLTIPKNIGFLSVFSTFAIFAVFLFSIAMIYKGALTLPTEGINPSVLTFQMNIHFFNAISVYSLMFALPALCLPLLKPVDPRISFRYRIVGTSFFSCYILVIVPGVLGYLLFGSDTKDIILDNFDNHDVFMQIIRFGFFVVVTASYPIVALTVAASLSHIIYKVFDPHTLDIKRRAIILFCTNFPPVLIAMVCPNIYPVISVGGALGGCLTNFFFPAVFWIKNSTLKWTHWTNILCILLAIFGFVSAAIATYQGIELAIYPDD